MRHQGCMDVHLVVVQPGRNDSHTTLGQCRVVKGRVSLIVSTPIGIYVRCRARVRVPIRQGFADTC